MTTNSQTRENSSRLSERAAAIAKDVRKVGDATKKVAVDSADAIRETAHDYLEQGTTQVRHVGDRMEAQLREKPFKSILIAAGIGFLFGAIWNRR